MNIKLSLLVLLVSATVFGHQEKELFLKAVSYYQEGNVQEALTIYQSIAQKSPAVLYNIGICYSVLGDYAQALSAFRNAEQNADPELMVKLDGAIQEVKKKLGHPIDSSHYRLFLLLTSYVSIFVVQVLCLLCLLLLMVLWWFRLGTRLRVAFILIGLVSTGLFCAFDYWLSSCHYAVVIESDVPLYAGPDAEYHTLFHVPKGQEVKVVEEQQSWYKVYSNGMYGWLEHKNLEQLI